MGPYRPSIELSSVSSRISRNRNLGNTSPEIGHRHCFPRFKLEEFTSPVFTLPLNPRICTCVRLRDVVPLLFESSILLGWWSPAYWLRSGTLLSSTWLQHHSVLGPSSTPSRSFSHSDLFDLRLTPSVPDWDQHFEIRWNFDRFTPLGVRILKR